MNVITTLLDWVKVQVKDKAGAFVLGILIGGAVVYSFYVSEKRVKEYVETENNRLKQDVINCTEDRKKDKEGFLQQMKELYYFQEQLKNGFQEVEHQSRTLATERKETLNNLER